MLAVICYFAVGFGGCQNLAIYIINATTYNASGENAAGDNSVSFKYTIYVGENGSITRSTGENALTFETKVSGTTQRLNNVKVTTSIGGNGNVVAVGNNGTVVRSTDMGNTWNVIPTATTANLYSVDFNGFFYAAGDNGTVLISPTGDIWTVIPVGTTRNLKAVGINPGNSGNVIVAGEKGTIFRSTNSGLNWLNVSLPDTTVNFNDISKKGLYFSSNLICLVGSGGKIYKSTDNGAAWVLKSSGTANDLKSIYFHTTDSVVVAGNNGTIKLSSNGGESWFSDANFNSPPGRNYRSVSLINRYKGTYSAISDTLFFVSKESITVGIDPISSQIAESFKLFQNYPNPFNPETKIKFELSKSGIASLKVYDIEGKEIETLINKELSTGQYEINFNGSKYPTGIYFYKLNTGNSQSVKKMMLLK